MFNRLQLSGRALVKKSVQWLMLLIAAVVLLAPGRAQAQAQKILLVCDLAVRATDFKNYLETLGHQVTTVTTVPATLSRNDYDQFWLALYGPEMSGNNQPNATTRTMLRTFMQQGGRIALFCDHSSAGAWVNARNAALGIMAFVDDIVPAAQKGKFSIETTALGGGGGDGGTHYAQVDMTSAAITNPDGAAEFSAKEYELFWPGRVLRPNLAGGYGVLQVKNFTNNLVGIAFSGDNLDPLYKAGRLFVFTDLGNALSNLFSGNTPILKFIASFTTGTLKNVSVTPVDNSTLNLACWNPHLVTANTSPPADSVKIWSNAATNATSLTLMSK